jgi:hypothetical protein
MFVIEMASKMIAPMEFFYWEGGISRVVIVTKSAQSNQFTHINKRLRDWKGGGFDPINCH